MDYRLTLIKITRKEKKQSKTGKSFHINSTSTQTSKLATTATKNLPFAKDQLKLIYKLLGKTKVTQSTPSTSYAFTQSGIIELIMCMTSILNNVPWIVGFGASDKMTQESKLFNTYMPCFGK